MNSTDNQIPNGYALLADVAKILKRSDSSLRGWVRERGLPGVMINGRSYVDVQAVTLYDRERTRFRHSVHKRQTPVVAPQPAPPQPMAGGLLARIAALEARVKRLEALLG